MDGHMDLFDLMADIEDEIASLSIIHYTLMSAIQPFERQDRRDGLVIEADRIQHILYAANKMTLAVIGKLRQIVNETYELEEDEPDSDTE